MNRLLMLNVGHATHMADWNFKDIVSPFTRIYYVTEGCATVTIGGMEYSLTPGNMYIIPAFTRHSDSCDGLFRHFYVHFYEDTGSESYIDGYEFPFEIGGRELDRRLFEALCEHNSSMALKAPDPRIYDNKHSLIDCVRLNRMRPLFDRMESAGIIYQLLARFMADATPKYQATDMRVRKAIESISNRSGELVRVDELAKEAHMSADHFIRLFKKELGYTPAQFIIERKMTQAMLMLASEPIMTKEVAYSLGYDNLSYFTRLFRTHTGMTPKQYRESFNS
ncbi:MAG: AraC family transcriptional regulator [Muribaculaceae bacterium]|nr:AraC family transcriptional regulator [Muribaculaceae bacterium]